MASKSRRSFLKTGAASGAALLGLGDLSFLGRLPPVRAEDAEIAPKFVEFRPEIEPLVRLIETTPRERLLQEIGARIQKGLSYPEVLAALQLAAIRNVQPRPSVGFKFHSVLVVHSAHLASVAGPSADRWLPILWALDYFKDAQRRDIDEGDWTMPAVRESRVPSATEARGQFCGALDRWDEGGADAASAAFARAAGLHEVFEVLFRYGMRDFRSIGHKAIYVANAYRTLGTIGWQHGEPIVRSLAYALLNHEGENPSTRDAPADRPWKRNLELAAKIRADWRGGKPDDGATRELLDVLRSGSDEDAPKKVVEILNRGVAAESVWDALFAAAGDFVLKQAGIISLHGATTTNALHFAYSVSGDDSTRRLAMLQNSAFLPLFRESMRGRGGVGDARIDGIEPIEPENAGDAIGEIFADRSKGIGKTLAFLEGGGSSRRLIDAARLLVFLKGDDAHDYKFSSAVLEDFIHVSPAWRNRFLAASIPLLKSASESDSSLVARAREALKG